MADILPVATAVERIWVNTPLLLPKQQIKSERAPYQHVLGHFNAALLPDLVEGARASP